MLTVIKRVVEEDISNRVTQKDALYEALTNAIQATATKIVCRFVGERQEMLKGDENDDLGIKRVVSMEIQDNGDGFNKENYESFGKYRTEHKIDLGCKGVGRFVFLKLFNEVSYISWQADSKIKREFKLSFNFESDDLVETNEEVEENKTILSLKDSCSDRFGRDRNIERRIELDLDKIRREALMHLIPTLFFSKKQGNHVEIEFVDSITKERVYITESDIPEFNSTNFEIYDSEGREIPFTLHHFVAGSKGSVDAYHCANRRSVCKFSDQNFKPLGFQGILLLESDFLNERVNNTRNDFDIFPIQTSLFNPLSWEMINKRLKSVVSDLVIAEIPDVQIKNKVKLKEIQEERPHLVQYIDTEDVKIAGFISKKQIITRAKKRFDQAKESLLESTGKSEYTNDELNEAIMVTQNELVAYIQDRVKVIERLKTMTVNKEKTEAVIHNLFMQQHTEDDNYDYFSPKRNNLWLLDDRFTSYSYAASDKRVKDVLDEVGSDDDLSKPDLSLFFSQSPDNKEGLKSVIVEIKSFDDAKRYSNKKMAGITQLLDYIDAFKKKEQIESIWAFLITDVDERFANKLKRDGFKNLFSTTTPIYHRYYEENDSSIYVIGSESLISDAEARNRIFIDIVNKQQSLENLLKH